MCQIVFLKYEPPIYYDFLKKIRPIPAVLKFSSLESWVWRHFHPKRPDLEYQVFPRVGGISGAP